LKVSGEEYKLTKTATTQPFFVNYSSGICNKDHGFIIEIKLNEFIGEDYLDNKIYTAIYPNIELIILHN